MELKSQNDTEHTRTLTLADWTIVIAALRGAEVQGASDVANRINIPAAEGPSIESEDLRAQIIDLENEIEELEQEQREDGRKISDLEDEVIKLEEKIDDLEEEASRLGEDA